MVSKILARENLRLTGNLNGAKISKLKQTAKKESIFLKPSREMIWKQINGKLVAEWVAGDLE